MYDLPWDACIGRLSQHLVSVTVPSAFSHLVFSGLWVCARRSSKFTTRGERELYFFLLQLGKKVQEGLD